MSPKKYIMQLTYHSKKKAQLTLETNSALININNIKDYISINFQFFCLLKFLYDLLYDIL